MNFEEQMRELAKDAQGFPWKARYNEVLYIHDSPKKGEWDYICVDVVGDEKDNDTAKHIAFNDPITAKLVSEVLAAARAASMEYPGGMDYRRIVKDLWRAFDALDAHHAKEKV